MQYRAAVCDDVKFYMEEMKEYIKEFCIREKKEITVTTYLDGSELMKDAKKCSYDIIFLDVDMPILNGIDAARQIREFDTDAVIIFVTSHDGFSFHATQVEAMGYIVKPIDKERLFRILKKALLLVHGIQEEKKRDSRFLEVNADYERIALDVHKIVYLQKLRNQMQVYKMDGKEYFFYDTIKNLMTILPRNEFCKISSNMIVNMAFVKDVKAYSISVEIGKKLQEYSVSRGCYKQLKQEYLLFLKNKKT